MCYIGKFSVRSALRVLLPAPGAPVRDDLRILSRYTQRGRIREPTEDKDNGDLHGHSC
jgi:hypothetical protein